MGEDRTVTLVVNMRAKKGYTNKLVGQCVQVPFIIVEGQSVQELTKNLLYEFKVYFNTFPGEAEKILEKYGKIVQTEEEKQETSDDSKTGWKGMKIEVPVPVSH
jgi:hypothetical protein